MAYSKETKAKILAILKSGVPITDVAKEFGMSRFTLNNWVNEDKEAEQDTKATIKNLKKQLSVLSKKNQTEAISRKVAMLSNALSKLERVEAKEQKARIPKPLVVLNMEGSLRERALKECNLYGYQKAFFEDPAQFRLVLKARQIGFSYVAALDALCSAVDNGRNQLFLSASEEQALILMRYVSMWAAKLGITFKKDSENEKVLPNGVIIKALAHNFRTVQGFTGDIYMDEFAWYANPKKIWHAFVPSIGAIKGRFTIMSTPFEEKSLFHDLCVDETKYFMFSRHRIDIYRAINDGLEFDLEVMKALFDADTWASAYECVFIDDESALFSISLIKSCVDPLFNYYMPNSVSPLVSGYDVGRVKDLGCLAALEPKEAGKYDMCTLEALRKASFDEQKMLIRSFLNTNVHARSRIDKTGIGLNLAEDMNKEFKSRVEGVTFTATIKEAMALNLKKMFEDKLIRIPNDPLLIADIHAIKRKAGARGFLYDADRNEHGHADRFWALALAASHAEVLRVRKQGRAYVVG